MEMVCFNCNGSGWAYRYPTNFVAKKEMFILIPCPTCKGKGFVEIKPEPPKEKHKC
jgi:DnaJ-class molecular chaperone